MQPIQRKITHHTMQLRSATEVTTLRSGKTIAYQAPSSDRATSVERLGKQKVLDLAGQRFGKRQFATLIQTVEQHPKLQKLILSKSCIIESQVTALQLLVSKNKGLRIIDNEGGKFGPAYMNWNAYYLSKNTSDLSVMKETVSEALSSIERDTGGLPSFVLDFGASVGDDTIPLVQAGCKKVWSVDCDVEALQKLRKNLPADCSSAVTCIHSPFKELQIEGQLDLLVASHTVPYRAPVDFPECWKKCVDAIKVGGYFAGHFFGPISNKQPDVGMTYHTEKEVRDLFCENFAIEWFKKEREGTDFKIYGGSDVPWGDLYHVVARKIK